MFNKQKLAAIAGLGLGILIMGLSGAHAGMNNNSSTGNASMDESSSMDDNATMDESSSMDSSSDKSSLDKSVMAALQKCKQVSPSCATSTKDAAGILVFPDVVKGDLIIGGAGGKGALIENGKISGYYNIGSLSAGLQAGVENATQVYVFRTAESLSELKKGSDWKVGASANVTLVTADANTRAASDSDVLAYIFDAKGLQAGVSLDVFNVWKSGQKRPEPS